MKNEKLHKNRAKNETLCKNRIQFTNLQQLINQKCKIM